MQVFELALAEVRHEISGAHTFRRDLDQAAVVVLIHQILDREDRDALALRFR